MTDADKTIIIRVLISTPGELEGDREKIATVLRGLEGWYGNLTRLERISLSDLGLVKGDSVEQNLERILHPDTGVDIAVFIVSSRSDKDSATAEKAEAWSCREVLDLMLTAMSKSEQHRPRILAYLRENTTPGRKSNDGRQGHDLVADLIQKKKLTAHFVTERFRDQAGHSLRAYDSNREPVGLTGRLQVHMLGHLSSLAGPAPLPSLPGAPKKVTTHPIRTRDASQTVASGTRRLLWGAFVIICLTIFLAYHTNTEYKNSEKNRQKIEELLAKTISKVRPTLQGIGQEKLIGDLSQQLDAYLNALPQTERMGALARQQAIQNSAEIEPAIARGDLAQAEKIALKALDAYQSLLEAEPENLPNLDAASAVELQLCTVYQTQHEKDKALQAVETAQKWRQQLVQAEPKNQRWLIKWADTELFYSRILSQQGRSADAQKVLETEITALKDQAKQNKDAFVWNNYICDANLDLAGLRAAQGDLPGSVRILSDNVPVAEQLAAQPTDAHYEDRQQQLLATYRQLAGTYTIQRNLDAARTNANQALAVIQQMLDASPSSESWKADCAAMELQLGGIYFDQGDLPNARASTQDALRLRSTLLAVHPDSMVYQNDLAFAHLKMGEVLQAQSSAASAKNEFQEAVTLCRHLVELAPNDVRRQTDLRTSLYRLGKLQALTGERDEAQKTLESALQISTQLAQLYPQEFSLQNDLATAHLNLGGFLQRVNDLKGARTHYQTALEIRQQQADKNTASTPAQSACVEACQVMSAFLIEQTDWPGAKQALESAIKIRQRQASADPKAASAQRNLSIAREDLGDVLQLQGDLDGAQQAYEAALKIRQTISETAPGDALAQSDLMVSRWKLGNLAVKRQKPDIAREQFNKGMDLLQKIASKPELASKQKQWSLAFSEALQSLQDKTKN